MARAKRPEASAPVAPDVVASPEVQAPKVALYTSDGILLNPEDFNVGSDGVLTPKP